MKIRIILALILLGSVLALPFLFRIRSGDSLTEEFEDGDTLVIISAHSEPMKYEYDHAFRKYYKERFGRNVKVDWRSTGGTSDIVRYIADRFEAEFRFFWESDPANGPWTPLIASSFANPAVDHDPDAPAEARLARKKFLESNVGIGIDLFAGGGTFDQSRHAKRGFAVDGGLFQRHPEYFKPEIIPFTFGGDTLVDRQGRYYGVCLSSFGICYNRDRIRELKVAPPERWSDLGRMELFNHIAVADPSKSGSANKCFEIILQQCMHESVPAGSKPSPALLDRGWANGMNLIKRIIANARTVTDSAGKVPRDIASGEAAAGLAIDFYGLTEQEWNAFQMNGKPVIAYVAPKGGTSVSADPIQMLRGAPHRKVAEAYLDFMIGPECQKLLDFRIGTPGGPVKYALRRSPVRKDLYAEKYRAFRADPDYFPYQSGLDFIYRPEWTGRYFSMIRILIRCVALDSREELCAAWKAIIEAGGPEKVPLAYQEFCRLPFEYRDAAKAAASLRVSKDHSAVNVAEVCRHWGDVSRESYRKALALAREGK